MLAMGDLTNINNSTDISSSLLSKKPKFAIQIQEII